MTSCRTSFVSTLHRDINLYLDSILAVRGKKVFRSFDIKKFMRRIIEYAGFCNSSHMISSVATI